MLVQAKANQLRIAPRKVNLVAGLIRGRSVADSIIILEHTPKSAAPLLAGAIKSAAANATHNHQLSGEKLIVSKILVGSGGMLKRFRPAAYGQAHPIRKRLTNITVELEEAPDTKKPAKAVTPKIKSTIPKPGAK